MIKVFVTSVITCFVFVSSSSVNYCGSKMCGNTNSHTFCQYPPGSSSDCIGYIEAPLSQDEKNRIVARLNQRRSQAARGLVQKLPTAANMLKLRWVEELAREAQLWADQCQPVSVPEEKDVCRDFYAVTVGQNIASIVGEAPGLKPESLADMWHMQSLHYKGNLTYLQPRNDIRYYGDFGQMIWAKTYMVGCGRSRFMSPHNGRLRSIERLVCNLAPRGPGEGRVLWTPGPPASACPRHTQPDTEFAGLCTHLSSLNYDDKTSLTSDDIQEDILLHTIFEVEKNKSLNHVGAIDEFYLTSMAVASLLTNDKPFIGTINKRDTAKKMADNNLNYDEVHTNKDEMSVNSKTKSKKKLNKGLVGRPKPYDIDYLNVVDGELNKKHKHLMRRRQNEDNDDEDDDDEDDEFDDDEKFSESYETVKKRSVNYGKQTTSTRTANINITYATEVPITSTYTDSYTHTIIDAFSPYTLNVNTLPIVHDDPGAFTLSATHQTPFYYSSIVSNYQSKHDTPNEIYLQTNPIESATAFNERNPQAAINEPKVNATQSYILKNSGISYQEQHFDTYITESIVNKNNFVTQNTSSEDYVATAVTYDKTTINYMATNTVENASATLPSTKTEEEYLSDPETVEQLQEALDRMEREMAGSPTQSNFSSKVRRDLSDKMNPQVRDYYQSIKGYATHTYNDTGKYEPQKEYPLNHNNVLLPKKDEKGPIINMVMKYLPSYLGQYKKQLRDITNDSNNLLPSMIQTLILLLACL